MSVIVSDSFNRANNTTTLGTTDSYNGGTAKAWQTTSTSYVYGINNNQAYEASSPTLDNKDDYAYIDVGISDCIYTLTPTTIADWMYIIFRGSDSTHYLAVRIDYVNKAYKIIQYNGGTETLLATATTNTANGDIVKVNCQGSTIKLNVNGADILTVTSTFNQTATRVGFGLFGRNSLRVDNFQVEDFNSGGGTPTGTNVSYQYSLKQQIYADRTNQASTKQSIYADRQNQFSIKQAFYADRQAQFSTQQKLYADQSNSFPIRQALFADRAFSYSLEQIIYADKQASFPSEQMIYADRSWQYPLQQQIYADYVLYSADFPIQVTIYQDVVETLQSVQKLYKDVSSGAPTRQEWYKDVIAQAVTEQVIYADRVQPFATRQEIWADRAYVFATMQEIIDPTHQIIGRIELKGQRDLYVYLKGSRDLTINLKGSL